MDEVCSPLGELAWAACLLHKIEFSENSSSAPSGPTIGRGKFTEITIVTSHPHAQPYSHTIPNLTFKQSSEVVSIVIITSI